MVKPRMTKQKKLILDIIKGTTCHPTADWIYQEARKEMPQISLGTVYRNLRFLVDLGEIMELGYSGSFSRFDGNPKNHYHFVCESCGEVFDVQSDIKQNLNSLVENGHRVFSHRLEFYGLCPKCNRNN